jgi:hypothetical protein
MEQTAVEWLEIQLFKKHGKFNKSDIDQAKKMEKRQIIEAHGNKKKTKNNPGSIVTFGYTYTGEMYYNEKFKGIKPII